VLEVVPRQPPSRVAALEQILQRGQVAGWPIFPAFADRIGLQSDTSPLEGASAVGYPASASLHFSGKDRERADLLLLIESMKTRGLEQLLLLSGDRLPGYDPGRAPIRYLESVPALQIAQAAAKPMLACVMRLTDMRAGALQVVPGIVVTESMRVLLRMEQQLSPAYANARSLDRMALQIAGL
jgi:hypothetical protein